MLFQNTIVRRVVKILLLSTGLLASSPVVASSWEWIAEDGNGAKYYYDSDSIKQSGDYIYVWVKSDRSKDKTTKHSYDKIYWLFDCKNDLSVMMSATTYSSTGTVIQNINVPDELIKVNRVVPDTVGFLIYKSVCRHSN